MIKSIAIIGFSLLSSILRVSAQSVDKTLAVKVIGFVDSSKMKYSISSQTYNLSGNDHILDQKAPYSWKKAVTLKSRAAFKNNYKKVVYPRLFLSFYEYKNHTGCDKAKSELLKCLGGDCTTVNWGENGSSVKSSPFIYIFNKNQIIVCHVFCEHINSDWEKFKKDLIKTFKQKNALTMELLACGAPLKFSD